MSKIYPLPHGCYCSNNGPSIHPQNWNTKKASIKKDWYIHYRFCDPSLKDIPGKKWIIQKVVKGGVNEYTTLGHRQEVIAALLDTEIEMLQQGYNPITGAVIPVETESAEEINPHTPFVEALKFALSIKECEKTTRTDITSVLRYFEKSAIHLGKSKTPIKDIRRKDIRMILDNCKNITVIKKNGQAQKKEWSNNQFNHFRKYISVLYSELEQLEVVEYNPVEKILKKEVTERIRETLTDEQRKKVDDHLREHHSLLHRFVNIFFHSGARRTELFKLQGKNVDLDKQQFKAIIRKGKRRREVLKTIKDIALPYWIEAMKNCGPDDYIFSLNLQPGPKAILPEYVTRQWRKHVKQELGITADLYSLKHSNLDEIAAALSSKDASQMADHSTPVITIKHYLVGEKQRQHDKLRKVNNSFA